MNASTPNGLGGTLLLNQTAGINESNQSVGKEFFNSTAPINMNKVNRFGMTTGLELQGDIVDINTRVS